MTGYLGLGWDLEFGVPFGMPFSPPFSLLLLLEAGEAWGRWDVPFKFVLELPVLVCFALLFEDGVLVELVSFVVLLVALPFAFGVEVGLGSVFILKAGVGVGVGDEGSRKFNCCMSGLFLAASDSLRGLLPSKILNKLWVMSIFGVFCCSFSSFFFF